LLVSRRAVRLALDVPKDGLVANQCVLSRKTRSGVCTPFPPVSRFTLKASENPQRRFAFVANSLYGSNNCSAGRQNAPACFNLSLTAVIQQFPTTDSGVAVRPKSSIS
jgi:hypothetical protein